MAKSRTCDQCKASAAEGMTGQWKHLWLFELDVDAGDDELAIAVELCPVCVKAVKKVLEDRAEFAHVVQA